MFELYLDTADIHQIIRYNACLPIRGITTNPSILARANTGLSEFLPKVTEVLGEQARIHVQVVTESTDAMCNEAFNLRKLPFDIVVKIPATETGLAAIKILKSQHIPVLATAIYSAQQGFLAALCGADYLAPYVNRIDTTGASGISVVADLQALIDRHQLPGKLLPASFKNTQQVFGALKAGVSAITIPAEIANELLTHPAVQPDVDSFNQNWRAVFGQTLPFES
ncbi:MAG: fructose-6-phosphate aldolase [Burkholderiales bacterium]|nr:hypothetical protein [Nitrosomonas sp.]MCP5273727.1 fructose-6-phosphate aldolase [Burkholderiales bacterium]